jgi:hypothetical protein
LLHVVHHHDDIITSSSSSGVSNAWREKRAMLHWWQAQIDLVRSMMLDIQADERLRLTGSKAFPSESARQQQEKEDPLLLLGTKTVTIVPAGLTSIPCITWIS